MMMLLHKGGALRVGIRAWLRCGRTLASYDRSCGPVENQDARRGGEGDEGEGARCSVRGRNFQTLFFLSWKQLEATLRLQRIVLYCLVCSPSAMLI